MLTTFACNIIVVYQKFIVVTKYESKLLTVNNDPSIVLVKSHEELEYKRKAQYSDTLKYLK